MLSVRADLKQLPKALYFIFVSSLINRLGMFVYPFLTLYFVNQRGLSLALAGALLSAGSLGMILGNLLGGALTDRWQAKGVILLSFIINICGYVGLTGSYASPYNYLVFLFIGLMGMGMYGPAANVVIANLSQLENRQFAYTVDYVFKNLGMAFGPLLGGFLALYSFQWVFYGDILSTFICLLLILFGLRDPIKSVQKSNDKSRDKRNFFSLLIAYPALTVFCAGGILLIGVLFGMEYLVPLLLKNVFHASTVVVGAVYTVNAAIILGGSFVVEHLLRKRNEPLMMVVSAIFWIVGMLIVVIGFNTPALLIGIACWTIGEIIYSIILPAFTSKNAPENYKGRFLALVDFTVSTARIIFPALLGFIWQHYGVRPALWLVTLLPCLGLLVYSGVFWIFRRQEKQTLDALPQRSA